MSDLHEIFKGKTVIVSGAASGIGRAIAVQCAKLGSHLAVCDFDNKGLLETVALLNNEPSAGTIHRAVFDVADAELWTSFLADTEIACGHIDVVINNAGIEGSTRPVWATSPDMLKRVMDVNFYGMVNGSQLSLPYLVKRPWAALVNVSSIFGLIGVPNASDYCASKFAIRGFTESLRAELLSVHPHVQVHLVHPGGINTQITRHANSQAFKNKFLKTKPKDMAFSIIEGIASNNPRVVFGNQAKSTHWASKLLPLSWLSKLASKQMQSLNMLDDYTKGHEGFEIPQSVKMKKDLS
jgi:butyryl-CoA dehydrogenase